MKIMKKWIVIAIVVGGIVLLGSLLFLIENRKETSSRPPLLPTPTRVQSNMFPLIVTPDMEKEKELETQYGLDRQVLLEEKPWLLQLPLQSYNYFVFYNVEKDQIIVDVYFYLSSPVDKSKQINDAKQDALYALNKAGMDTNKEKVVFVEKQK